MKKIIVIIMKNTFIFVSFLILTLDGCSLSSESNTMIEDKTTIQQQNGKGIIPSDHKSNELTMLVGKYSLTDLDDYYRNELPREKRQDYYNNVRKTLISSMVKCYGLLEKGDDKSIKFYLEELRELKLMNPNVTMKLLIRAEKSMNPEDVRVIAAQIYDFNQKVIARLEDSEAFWAEHGKEWEEIKFFSERLN